MRVNLKKPVVKDADIMAAMELDQWYTVRQVMQACEDVGFYASAGEVRGAMQRKRKDGYIELDMQANGLGLWCKRKDLPNDKKKRHDVRVAEVPTYGDGSLSDRTVSVSLLKEPWLEGAEDEI